MKLVQSVFAKLPLSKQNIKLHLLDLNDSATTVSLSHLFPTNNPASCHVQPLQRTLVIRHKTCPFRTVLPRPTGNQIMT